MAVFWFRDNRGDPHHQKVQQRAAEMAESRCTVTKPFGLTVRSNYRSSVRSPSRCDTADLQQPGIGYSRPDPDSAKPPVDRPLEGAAADGIQWNTPV